MPRTVHSTVCGKVDIELSTSEAPNQIHISSGHNNRYTPVIDKTFPFGNSKEALAYLEKGRAKGKVVVRMK